MEGPSSYSSAIQDFKRARRQAALQEVLARIAGKSQRLVSFEEIRKRVGQGGMLPRGLQEIPLDAIVGSVGRYEDFNRQFLPRQEVQPGRWARVRMAMEGRGLPPIEVYKLGEVYFVLDGHHRVSVARQVGAKQVEAYVTEIPISVPLSAEDDADELILKAEQARFLTDTGLGALRSEVELKVTSPGRYRELREHIAVHQYYMGLDLKRDIPFEEAADRWINHVYLPAVRAIRSQGLLREFPDRTETDLYLWLMKHRSELMEDLGWELEAEEAARDLSERFSLRPRRILKRVWNAILAFLTPNELEAGPQAGEWRREKSVALAEEQLFGRILVALSGEAHSWQALEQALLVAKREGGRLRGLHVLPKDGAKASGAVQKIRQDFEERLEAEGVAGRLVLDEGEVARRVERRARWSDLVVLHLEHPPGEGAAERLRSGLRTLLQRSPRPVLLVARASKMQHALLAYDGSQKAKEALYVAAYVAQRWDVRLSVLAADQQSGKSQRMLDSAKAYLLAQGVKAEYFQRSAPAAEAIMKLAAERGCDFILMGGYGAAPLLGVVIGSTVDQVLREFNGPVLVCR